jgi:hypothetical protein
VFAHGHQNASELPNAFSLLATHGFTWLRVPNYQRRTNCRHAKNYRRRTMENSIPKKITSPKKFKGWQILTASVLFWNLASGEFYKPAVK